MKLNSLDLCHRSAGEKAGLLPGAKGRQPAWFLSWKSTVVWESCSFTRKPSCSPDPVPHASAATRWAAPDRTAAPAGPRQRVTRAGSYNPGSRPPQAC